MKPYLSSRRVNQTFPNQIVPRTSASRSCHPKPKFCAAARSACLLRLLRAIYAGQTAGYLTLTAIHPDKQHPTPSRHIQITHKAAIHAALDDLRRANQQGWGAFFSPAVRAKPLDRWHRGGQGDLLTLPVLFADLDGDLPTSFDRLQRSGWREPRLPPPSALLGSGRGLHLYWFIEPTTDFVLADQVLAGLAQQLGGDVLNTTYAMRLPGTHNTKPAVNRPCQLLWLTEQRRYTLTDFAAFQVEPAPAPSPEVTVRAPPDPAHDPLNPALVQQVVTVLLAEQRGFVQKNGWIGSLCPGGHARDAPGKHFGFLPDKGVARCFGRHGRILLKDLCTLLEIDPAPYGGVYQKGNSHEQENR